MKERVKIKMEEGREIKRDLVVLLLLFQNIYLYISINVFLKKTTVVKTNLKNVCSF